MKKLPKKSLGQNFLTSPAIAEQIVTASGVGKNDTVIEIGPGKGVLTRVLSRISKNVIAIEKDSELVQNFGSNVMVIEGDIRDLNLASLHLPDRYAVVANIPYYITGEIIRLFLSADKQPASMTLLVQKEVAERIVAREKKESILSLSIKVYGTPRYVRTVAAGVFFPKPKVDSAVLHIENISRKHFTTKTEEERFFFLIKKAFNGKRKTIGRTIGNDVPMSKELAARRPETLALNEWLTLAREKIKVKFQQSE